MAVGYFVNYINYRGGPMGAHAISLIKFLVSVLMAVFAAVVALLEVVVAIKFQFATNLILDTGLWILNLELPEEINLYAAWMGAALWILVDVNFLVEVIKNVPRKLNATEITAFTAIAAIPAWGAVDEPFALSIWLNVALWVLAAIGAASATNN